MTRRPVPLMILAVAVLACGSVSPPSEGSRYPDKRRPEPARSASDGEVLGANRQAPEDTLEGSATTAHPGPGWEMENGVPVPKKERRGAPTDSRDCVPASEAATLASTDPRRNKPVCPPEAAPARN